MKPSDILFEKIIYDGTIPSDVLIKTSERRRTFLRSLSSGANKVKTASEYYTSLSFLIKEMQFRRTKLLKQPLFIWNKQSSNSFLFERLNVENLLSDIYESAATETKDLKKRKKMYENSVGASLSALNTLGKYAWEDVSLLKNDIFQDRYHLYKVFKNTGYYYATMNDYCLQQENNMNKLCTERAYYFLDTANMVWKEDPSLANPIMKWKAYHLLEVANAFQDEYGRKVALLKDIVGVESTPTKVVEEYKAWKQLNDSVYYEKEECEYEITFPSVEDLFQSLPKTAE